MSDEDTSFTNSSVEDIDIDTIDETGGNKPVKKSKGEVLAIEGGATTVALADSESGSEEGEVRRKQSPFAKYKALVDKYTQRSNQIKESIKQLEHPNSSKGRKKKLTGEETALVNQHKINLVQSERKKAKALTLFEAVKRSNNFSTTTSVPENQRQSQRLLLAQQSPNTSSADTSTQRLIAQNQSLSKENFLRTAELVHLTNQHQHQQQQAYEHIVGLELQRQQQERQKDQQIAVLTTATIEAQNIARSAQDAVASIAAEKAVLATQNTVVYSEASNHIANLNNQITEQSSEISILKDQLQKAISESANWKVTCLEATKHSTDKNKEIEAAKTSYTTLLSKYKELEENYNINYSAKTVELEGKIREIESLKSHIEQLAASANTSDNEAVIKLQQSLSRIDQLEAESSTQKGLFNQEVAKLKSDIKNKEEAVSKHIATINTLNDEYRKVVETKEKLEALVSENLATHELQLQNVEANHNHTVTKYVNKIEELNKNITQLKSSLQEREKELLSYRSIEYMSKGLLSPASNTPTVMTSTTPTMAVNLTSDLSELVSIPIRQEIRKFSGIGGERVQSWFSASEQLGRSAGWGKQLMRRYFPARFTGPAAAYQEQIDNEGRLTDYDEWKKDIIEQFRDPNETTKFRRELADIKQRDDERIKDFKARIIKLFTKGYGDKAFKSTDPEMTAMREDVLKKSFNDGLREDIAIGYWNRIKGDASFEESTVTASEVEKVQSAKRSTSGPSVHGVVNSLIQNQKQVCTNLNMITDKIQQLSIDRKPSSEQLNYIENPQRSHSPNRSRTEANVQVKPGNTQGERRDSVRKVHFSERLHPNNPLRAGISVHRSRTFTNSAINRYPNSGSRNLSGGGPQPGIIRQRSGLNRSGKPNFKPPSERLCFGCGSLFHFIAKCPLKKGPRRPQFRRIPLRMEGRKLSMMH